MSRAEQSDNIKIKRDWCSGVLVFWCPGALVLRCVVILLLLCSFSSGCSRAATKGVYARTEMLMDTFVQIRVYDSEKSSEKIEEIIDEAFDLARSIENRLSIFDVNSELNRLNISRELSASKDLFNVLDEAKKVSRLTGGEFDVTVTPVLKKDGFYSSMPAMILNKIPDSFDGIGWKNIELDDENFFVRLFNNAWVDLSGIAKGYMVDRISEYFRDNGIDSFLVNAGGDIYCTSKPNDETWKVGVRNPGFSNVAAALSIKNRAVATSGDYENFVADEATGEVLSHIIDPSTDRALKKSISSVTVIAASCSEADAFATGMMAMGKNKAMELAERIEGVDVIFVQESDGNKIIDASGEAEKYLIR